MSPLVLRTAVRPWLVAVCLLGLPGWTFGDDEAELLALAKAGYRSAQKSIHSLSCTVAYEAGFPDPVMRKKGKYWRSFDRVRIQEQLPEGTQDFFWGPEGEARYVYRGRNAQGEQVGAGRRLVIEVTQPLDVWRYMLLEFDRYVQQAKQTPRVKRDRINGRDCIVLTMPYPFDNEELTTVTYWLDVGYNYLPWKREIVGKGSRDDWEILEYAEPKPGMFFPSKSQGKVHNGRRQIGAGSIVVSDLRINEPIAKEVLQLPALPRGTHISDMIKKQRYRANENWEQLPGSRAEHSEITARPPETVGEHGGWGAQSTSEASSWTLWIAPASVAVVLMAGGAWLYRRYCAGSTQSL